MRERKDTNAPNSLGMRNIRNVTTAREEILNIEEHSDNYVPITMKMLTKSTALRKILNFRIKLL